jgi:hypothetical protein
MIGECGVCVAWGLLQPSNDVHCTRAKKRCGIAIEAYHRDVHGWTGTKKVRKDDPSSVSRPSKLLKPFRFVTTSENR